MSRDTQFQGFAKALYEELQNALLHMDYSTWTPELATKLRKDIIARRAYDLACHVAEQMNYGLDTHTIEDAVRDIPDLLELPKEQE